mmetsp:Transcript_28748/g.27539  ORF Transcript_28748/g.27539 Transcript_28748/m.27539 type:complete len:368 (+) Transcript_28748:205-1308(+)
MFNENHTPLLGKGNVDMRFKDRRNKQRDLKMDVECRLKAANDSFPSSSSHMRNILPEGDIAPPSTLSLSESNKITHRRQQLTLSSNTSNTNANSLAASRTGSSTSPQQLSLSTPPQQHLMTSPPQIKTSGSFQTSSIPTLPSIGKQKEMENKPNISIIKQRDIEDKPNKLKTNNVLNGVPLCCDKCDGRHETSVCPYYKKIRDVHIDAQKNGWKLLGHSSNLPGALLRTAKIVPQPGDGSCLFHSMSYGIRDKSSATSLRRDICSYIQQHPLTPICDTPLSDWVDWDSGTSCSDYARKMSYGAWGGGIEMACMSRLKDCNVHVYESLRSGGFKRISAFDNPIDPQLKRNVRVLYRGGVHYDALVKTE